MTLTDDDVERLDRDMRDGMTEEDMQALVPIQKNMRDLIARTPGADQVESRLRAYTMFAATATAMQGQPVVVSWCETQGVIHQCHADGTVKTVTAVPDGRTH